MTAFEIVKRIYRSARERGMFDRIDDVTISDIINGWYREVAGVLVGNAAGVKFHSPEHLLAHLRDEVY